MASREDEETIRRFYECCNRGDIDAAVECTHDDIEFNWSASMGPFGGTYVGHTGMVRFWDEMIEPWEEFQLELEEMIACGRDSLLTVTRIRARGRGSGVETESRGAMIWKLRNGKISAARLYQTREEALEDVTAMTAEDR